MPQFGTALLAAQVPAPGPLELQHHFLQLSVPQQNVHMLQVDCYRKLSAEVQSPMLVLRRFLVSACINFGGNMHAICHR